MRGKGKMCEGTPGLMESSGMKAELPELCFWRGAASGETSLYHSHPTEQQGNDAILAVLRMRITLNLCDLWIPWQSSLLPSAIAVAWAGEPMAPSAVWLVVMDRHMAFLMGTTFWPR